MSTSGTSRNDSLLSRRQIEGLIADGRKIIIVDQKVLKVDPWLIYHPGGDKAILHMVGRDATDELNAYVPISFTVTSVLRNLSYSFTDRLCLVVYIPQKPGSRCYGIKLAELKIGGRIFSLRYKEVYIAHLSTASWTRVA